MKGNFQWTFSAVRSTYGGFILLQWILSRDREELLHWTDLLLLKSKFALIVSIGAIVSLAAVLMEYSVPLIHRQSVLCC